MDYNLDFLYYIKPDEYRRTLDGDDDPNWREITQAGKKFSQFMATCPLSIFVCVTLEAFRSIFPNEIDYQLSVLNYSFVNGVGEPLREKRDITDIRFHWETIVDEDGDEDDGALEYFVIVFKEEQSQLPDWVTTGLGDKKNTKSTAGNVITWTVEESPIQKIEAEGKELRLFMDKERYIKYSS